VQETPDADSGGWLKDRGAFKKACKDTVREKGRDSKRRKQKRANHSFQIPTIRKAAFFGRSPQIKEEKGKRGASQKEKGEKLAQKEDYKGVAE